MAALKLTDYGVSISHGDAIAANVKDPRDILESIGAYLVGQTNRAFVTQGLPGADKWKAKYPNQEDPVLSVAGVLQSFIDGEKPKSVDMQRRPALRRSGNLMAFWDMTNKGAMSLKGRYTVEIGASGWIAQYAGLQQWGGVSRQPVTPSTKSKIRAWLQEIKGDRQKAVTDRDHMKYKAISKKFEQAQKIGFLIKESITDLKTHVNPRPFLGVTPIMAKEIRQIIEGEIPGSPKHDK